jgi:inosine-uridine nucleoside N-ribohydrolase
MKSNDTLPVPVIFDTDMDIDCDDTGALAVLHALMDKGKTKILGIICDVPVQATAKVAVAINKYYTRVNIPVGIVCDDEYEKGKKYKMYRFAKKNHISRTNGYYPIKVAAQFYPRELKDHKFKDDVTLYRELLSQSEDNSVVIIAVGLLTALKNLLESEPDDITSLSGLELVKKKVLKLITMGMGRFPSCNAEFNWLMDWDAARKVINNWPTELVVSTYGNQFLTGKTLTSKTPETNPVRKCYEIYLQGGNKGNYSWDLIAALYGVRGADPYFEELKGYRIILEEELGKNHWIEDDSRKSAHIYLKLKNPKRLLKKELENLMTKPPKKND